MQGTITSVKNTMSRYGGNVYLVTFKCEDGKSRRSWIDPKNGNYQRWKNHIEKGKGINLTGLSLKGEQFIDADSYPSEII